MKPAVNIPDLELTAISQLAADLQTRELEVAKARGRLAIAIKAAVKSHPQSAVARAAGVSRQWVGQLLARENGGA